LSGARSERIDEMNTHLTTDDLARQTVPASGRTLDSILRTLTVAVALLVFGFSAPMVFADHMGNHERTVDQSVTECSSDEGVLSATEATEPAEEDETVPARPFELRPW
jgi:hypothetical protein